MQSTLYEVMLQIRKDTNTNLIDVRRMRQRKIATLDTKVFFNFELPGRGEPVVLRASFLLAGVTDVPYRFRSFPSYVISVEHGVKLTINLRTWDEALKFVNRLPGRLPCGPSVVPVRTDGGHPVTLAELLSAFDTGKKDFTFTYQTKHVMKELRQEVRSAGFSA